MTDESDCPVFWGLSKISFHREGDNEWSRTLFYPLLGLPDLFDRDMLPMCPHRCSFALNFCWNIVSSRWLSHWKAVDAHLYFFPHDWYWWEPCCGLTSLSITLKSVYIGKLYSSLQPSDHLGSMSIWFCLCPRLQIDLFCWVLANNIRVLYVFLLSHCFMPFSISPHFPLIQLSMASFILFLRSLPVVRYCTAAP